MTGIAKGNTGSEVQLSSAILFYSGQNGDQFATIHPVSHDPKTSRPLIGAGRPMDRNALLGTLRNLDKNAAPKADFLPPTVLAISPDALTWWCTPASRRVFFDCKELGKRSAVVPHPGLVFQAAAKGFSVFALKDAGRPSLDSVLFEPPYFNTWDMGQICIGSAQVPRRIDVASIDGWESGFFNSAFTHPNVGGKRVDYETGFFAFWRDMLDGKFDAGFPLELLVPVKPTLADLIGGKIGRAQ
ncbi:PRTRC system protein B [Paraburkholderia sp. D1E]|uniref:PRTRC system protein B n=1 Tax=Paraburkholderia sp. D1E TaxID=3461398 RepID=UPI004045F949